LGEIIVTHPEPLKKKYKTHEQFIRIAYIDLFNKTIDPQRFSGARNIFDSQGDDDLNYRLFVRKLITEAKLQLPPDKVIKREPDKFIEQSYLKFFGRYPNGYEKKVLINDINQIKDSVADKIYYILMTSEEYRTF